MKKKICLVVSSAMTVNAFLREPVMRLSEYYDVNLSLKLNPEDSLYGLEDLVDIFPVDIERKISPYRDFLAVCKLVRLFRRNRFNLVHSVTPKAGLLAMISAYIAGVNIRIHTFTGQVWATRTGLSRLLLKKADKLIGWLSTDVLADSNSQLRFLIHEGVISESKSGVLSQGSISGVNTSRFKPDDASRAKIRGELSIPEEDIVFLYIGRLNRDKGLLDLASAFAGIGNNNTHLLVVGPDEEFIGPQMLKLAERNSQRVHLIGFAVKPEEYLAAVDVLCLPSYREGFGNTVIEAAAAGIPAIGSRIYGLTDAISENETGLMFEAGNVGELKNCISVLTNEKELRIRLGRKARERVFEQFTSEKLVSSWINYYRARL